jgi:hypothetical protein
MTSEEFEEKLDALVSEAFDAGLDPDSILSALELKVQAYREELGNE